MAEIKEEIIDLPFPKVPIGVFYDKWQKHFGVFSLNLYLYHGKVKVKNVITITEYELELTYIKPNDFIQMKADVEIQEMLYELEKYEIKLLQFPMKGRIERVLFQMKMERDYLSMIGMSRGVTMLEKFIEEIEKYVLGIK